ncbi:hypothetical protein H072_8572 [Dactylellina haptotyla CBS 200.50]|uniref:Uncharacterized protein n=1 Tax=Dactylellina haptotyla (strain CBS 200.50) TaxID=1284197 RepID=S8A9G6_DACHA|nr:hypothetical protein H072_8572 [Dactylellina haptotyla CBS 200.50]
MASTISQSASEIGGAVKDGESRKKRDARMLFTPPQEDIELPGGKPDLSENETLAHSMDDTTSEDAPGTPDYMSPLALQEQSVIKSRTPPDEQASNGTAPQHSNRAYDQSNRVIVLPPARVMIASAENQDVNPEYINSQPLPDVQSNSSHMPPPTSQFSTQFQSQYTYQTDQPRPPVTANMEIDVELHIKNREALARNDYHLRATRKILYSSYTINHPHLPPARIAHLPPIPGQYEHHVSVDRALRSIDNALITNSKAYHLNERVLNPFYNYENPAAMAPPGSYPQQYSRTYNHQETSSYNAPTITTSRQTVSPLATHLAVTKISADGVASGERAEQAASALVQLSEPRGQANIEGSGTSSTDAGSECSGPSKQSDLEHQGYHASGAEGYISPVSKTSVDSMRAQEDEEDLDGDVAMDEVEMEENCERKKSRDSKRAVQYKRGIMGGNRRGLRSRK